MQTSPERCFLTALDLFFFCCPSPLFPLSLFLYSHSIPTAIRAPCRRAALSRCMRSTGYGITWKSTRRRPFLSRKCTMNTSEWRPTVTNHCSTFSVGTRQNLTSSSPLSPRRWQELLRQSRLQSTECGRLWEDHEECLSQHESTATGHERQIQISFHS